MWNAEPVDVGIFASVPRFGDLGVHAVIDLRRRFTRAEVEAAARAAMDAFPVLGCTYQARFFRDVWLPAQDPIADAVFAPEGDLDEQTHHFTHHPIDPTRVPPLRLVLLQKADGCRLIVSLSHIAVDGSGMAAVGHILGSSLYGLAPSLPVEPRRDLLRALDGLKFYHLPVLVRDAVRTLALPLRTYAAARRERPYPSEASLQPTTRQLVFEAAEIEAIRARCGGRTSVNDLLVAAVARVGASRSKGGAVAVMYTMDLRRFSRSPHLSAANASTILTTLVPRDATHNLATATRVVGKLTADHRNSLLGPAFVLLPLALAGLTPHALLRRIVPGIHPVAVDLPLRRGLVFTNVGRIDHGLGPMSDDIESLRVVGPNMRGVAVPSIVAFGLGGRLHLELFAPPGLGEAALDELEHELYAALEHTP